MMHWGLIDTLPLDFGLYERFDVWTARGFRIPNCWLGITTYGRERGIVYEADYDSDGYVVELVEDATHWMRVSSPE